MASAAVTYSFTAGATAVAAQVNQDFTDLVTFLNASVVHVDGSKTMTGALTLAASDPASANQAARKSYVDQNARYKGGNASGGGIAAQALVGSLPLTDTQLKIQSGVVLATTDANGEVAVTLPVAFASSFVSVVVLNTNGALHGNALNTGHFTYSVTAQLLSSFWVKAFFVAGGAGAASTTAIAFTWLALGF